MSSTNMIANSVLSSQEQSPSHSIMYSHNQTNMRDIELSNRQVTHTINKDESRQSDEILQEKDKTKDLKNTKEIDKCMETRDVNNGRFEQTCEIEFTEQSDFTKTDEAKEEASSSSNECNLEDCSPQKRREKRQKRKKRKSLNEILFV